MANAETRCPKCGLTPIPDRTETCPRCKEVFSFNPLYKAAQRQMIGRQEALDFEATLRGGLTGAVSANPGPAAAVLALAAAGWLIRAAGLFVDLHEPSWLFALAAVELVAATVLMANVGPAKLFAQAVALAHIVAALVLAGSQPLALHTLLSALVGVVVIAMTVGEPSKVRRGAGLALGGSAALATIGALAWATVAVRSESVVLGDLRLGYQLTVPEGWKQLTSPEQLQPHLRLPSDDLVHRYLGFGSPAERTWGVLMVSGPQSAALSEACREQLKRLGAVNEAVPLAFTAPAGLGNEAIVFELRTASGALGRLGCGRVGQRLVALGVVVLDPAPAAGAAAFQRLAKQLTVVSSE